MFVCLVGCLTSRQHASVSQGRICSDNFTCCHNEIEVADQTFRLTQSQNIDIGPTSPSTDPITPGDWQGSHWSANFEVTGMTRPREKSRRKRDTKPGYSALEADAFTTGPTEWGNGVRTHVNSEGKIPSTRSSESDRTLDAGSRRTANPIHYRLSYSGPYCKD